MAREALIQKRINYANQIAKKVMSLDLTLEDFRLTLFTTSKPDESVYYLLKVLTQNPPYKKAKEGTVRKQARRKKPVKSSAFICV